MNRTYHVYTTGEDATIRRMWETHSKQDIADEIGVSLKSLEDHIRTMNPPLPREVPRGRLKWEEFEDNALILMVAFGIPYDYIATALQRGVRSCKDRIAHLRKTRRNKHGY